jgi:hypothetical protein
VQPLQQLSVAGFCFSNLSSLLSVIDYDFDYALVIVL